MITQVLSSNQITDDILFEVAAILKKGNLVSFPTETVYGLGAYMFNKQAVREIFAIKERMRIKSLIVHLSKLEDVEKIAYTIPQSFYLLAEKFLAGPLTIVIKKEKELFSWISPDNTIAIRMPSHRIAIRLIDLLGSPIVGTSANISGNKSPTTIKDVLKDLDGKIPMVLDGGRCRVGIPSTIISLVGKVPRILRKGKITKEQLEEVLEEKVLDI